MSLILLLPTPERSAPLASICVALLRRYWPDHPPVHVLYGGVKPRVYGEGTSLHVAAPTDVFPWLGPIRSFLRQQRDEDLVLLMLDDYALCGPSKAKIIGAGARMMREEPSIGLFPLCWYPAARREPRWGRPGIETLTGTSVLLQAAIWRRSWFLQLAETMDDRTSPWSLEAMATQRAKVHRAEICAAQMPPPRQVRGHFIDGLDKSDWPLPYHNLMHRGEPALEHEAFLRHEGFAFPARGLGDSVATITQATGIATVVDRISRATGRDCGCGGRRGLLNRVAPYRR